MTKLPVIQVGDFSNWLSTTIRIPQDNLDAKVPCGDCVGCCSASYFIHIGADESEPLAVIPRELLFAAPGMPEGSLLMGFDERGHCPMLFEGQCSIYAQRPRTCRDYDCRVLAAANMQAGGVERTAINERAQQWRFQFANRQARESQQAVERAADFLREHRDLFPLDFLPTNPSQLARLAISVYEEFLTEPQRQPADRVKSLVESVQLLQLVR